MATVRSGSMSTLRRSFWSASLTRSRTAGILEDPPTMTTSSMSCGRRSTASSASSMGTRLRRNSSAHASLKSARVSVKVRISHAPRFVVARQDTTASEALVSAILACSARARFSVSSPHGRRSSAAFAGHFDVFTASLSARTSCTRRPRHMSKSEPPRRPSPADPMTCTDPSLTKRMDTSSVPPPKSYTRMWFTSSLRWRS
mmetsp:Transcript_4745/g.13518  ORF Transcript_4745/g.13518 Transcript_4745/m.13518 type:complete len:201 (+) Transcript_4745:864-1466(+)